MGRARSTCLLTVFLCVFLPLGAQSSLETRITAYPVAAIPLGPTLEDGLPFYTFGAGGEIGFDLSLSKLPLLFARGLFGFEYLPINNSDSGISFLSLGGDLGLNLNLGSRLAVRLSGGGGMYMGISDAGSVRNPYAEGGGELRLRITPSLQVGVGADYRYRFVPAGSLYEGVSVRLGLGYDLAGSKRGTGIRLEPSLEPVFPLFYTYYNKNPTGTFTIENGESVALERVQVSFYAKQFMDSPRTCAEIDAIAPGTSTEVPAYAIFNEAIFRVTEGTKAAGEVTVEYYFLGQARKKVFPVTLEVRNRNALVWDDDRKAAAFVSAKDPLVLGFAKNVASAIGSSGATVVSRNFSLAAGIFQAEGLLGLTYTVDPQTPYTARDGKAVDFLQFPNQTLSFRAGDCDDLSVLYAALLESVGVPTAFVTIPGHIFLAFDTGLSPDAAGKLFKSDDDFFVEGGRSWVPVEITMVRDGFHKAWNTGSREWSDGKAKGAAGFFEVRKAWELYEPVGFAEGGIAIAMPAADKLNASLRKELDRIVSAQTGDRMAAIGNEKGVKPESAANRRGILYAQFGLLAQAKTEFQKSLDAKENVAAYVNLGNLAYLEDKLQESQRAFERALLIAPDNATALLGLAKAYKAAGQGKKFDETSSKLSQVNPELAKRYLAADAAAAGRAAEMNVKEVESWAE